MDIILLVRLLIAHLLTDFLLQPTSWIEDRENKKIKSVKLLLHICLTTLMAYLLSGLYGNWWLPLVVFVSHYLIDLAKVYFTKGQFIYFFADQLAHLTVLVVIWLIITQQWPAVTTIWCELASNRPFWMITLGYVFVTWPLGIMIGLATKQWRDAIEPQVPVKANSVAAKAAETGLANAGKWIGICERMLIFTFILTQQYTAIGFLMTAKSILRFGDKEANTQKKTEYILVGTLLSFAASALVGVAVYYTIHGVSFFK